MTVSFRGLGRMENDRRKPAMDQKKNLPQEPCESNETSDSAQNGGSHDDSISHKLDAFASTQNPFPDQQQASRSVYTPSMPSFQPGTPAAQKQREGQKEQPKEKPFDSGAQEQPKQQQSSGGGYNTDAAGRKTRLIIIAVVILLVLFYQYVILGNRMPGEEEPSGDAAFCLEAATEEMISLSDF